MEAQVSLSPRDLPSSARRIAGSQFSDSIFLAVTVALSSVLYVSWLGFYSDDWAFLAWLVDSPDRALVGLFRAVWSEIHRMRPGQMFHFALLYKLFDLEPLGYHLVNTAVFTLGVLLFHLALRELSVPRLIALTAPLVYALLPHYSSNRLWILASVVTLSVSTYMLSLYADLRAMASAQWREVAMWKVVSVLGLLASTLSYELVLPLFLLTPLLLVQRARQSSGNVSIGASARRVLILSGISLLALAVVVVFKLQTTIRGGIPFDYWWWISAFSERVIAVNLGELLVGLPTLVWQILTHDPKPQLVITGAGLGLLISWYVYRVSAASPWPHQMVWLNCLGAGAVVFVLGYAIFLTNMQAWPTPFGIANRTAMAAAIGLSFTLVAALGFACGWLPRRFRPTAFCIAIAAVGVAGFLVINTIASFWVSASKRQQDILADIHGRFTTLAPGTTFLLDGVCPYVGPAVVFESSWDLQGALRILFREMDLRADVVTPNLTFDADGVATALYGTRMITKYPYGQDTFVYHRGLNLVTPLPDVAAATQYFRTVHTSRNADACPPGEAGAGSPMF